jgi:hypothetical protein
LSVGVLLHRPFPCPACFRPDHFQHSFQYMGLSCMRHHGVVVGD